MIASGPEATKEASRKLFTLLVEMRCNSYCIFCGEREVDEAVVKSRRRLGLMVPETMFGHLRERYTIASATEALERARAEGFTDLSFQGGEPTIFPEIVELVRRARSLDFAFLGMVTNGRKLKERDFTEALLGAGLDGITLSILGPDAETHDALAAAPGSFEAMITGLDHAVDVARRLDRRLVVNANIIVSAKSVDGLAEMVRLLAAHGAHAGVLHLVRFNNLASDPAVKEPLRFPIQRIRPALAAAMAEAERVGFSLHASDVPLCLHPRLAAAELARVAREQRVRDHLFQAPGYTHGGPTERPAPDACQGCLLIESCRFVPAEYLPEDPAIALAPITAGALAERVDETLATIKSGDPGAIAAIVDLAEALRIFGEVTGRAAEVAAPLARARGALVGRVLHAFQRRDGRAMMEAFSGLVGLRAKATWTIPEDTWTLVLMPLYTLAANAGAVAEEKAPRGPRVVIDDRYAIAIEGEIEGDGSVAARAVRAIVPEAKTTPERVLRAIFLALIALPLRRATRFRVTADALEVDLGAGLVPAWHLARPGAVRLVT